MSIILQRLDTSFGLSLDSDDVNNKRSIESVIGSLKYYARKNVVLHHVEINLEYELLSTTIAKKLRHKNLTEAQNLIKQQESLRKQVESLLKIATLLEILYSNYLCDLKDVRRIQEQQNKLRVLLNQLPEQSKPQTSSTTSELVFWLTSYNIIRLFSIRLLRLLRAIALLTHELSLYSRSIKQIDYFAIPLFTHMAWVFFIPRLTVNLTMVMKHTIPNYWMSQEEKKLDWLTRFKIQWNMRWPDISNDLPWFIANLTSAFVLIGNLAPYSIYLSIGMQFYEIAQAYAQWHVETNNLRRQINEYKRRLPDSIDKAAFIEELETRWTFDNKRLRLSVLNTSVLLLAIILSAPAIAAISPIMPITGGCIAVTTTIVSYQHREQLRDDYKSKAPDLFSFFKPSTLPGHQSLNQQVNAVIPYKP